MPLTISGSFTYSTWWCHNHRCISQIITDAEFGAFCREQSGWLFPLWNTESDACVLENWDVICLITDCLSIVSQYIPEQPVAFCSKIAPYKEENGNFPFCAAQIYGSLWHAVANTEQQGNFAQGVMYLFLKVGVRHGMYWTRVRVTDVRTAVLGMH